MNYKKDYVLQLVIFTLVLLTLLGLILLSADSFAATVSGTGPRKLTTKVVELQNLKQVEDKLSADGYKLMLTVNEYFFCQKVPKCKEYLQMYDTASTSMRIVKFYKLTVMSGDRLQAGYHLFMIKNKPIPSTYVCLIYFDQERVLDLKMDIAECMSKLQKAEKQ